MKAERRHALQQNALAAKVMQLPNYGKVWIQRGIIALVVLIILTLIVLMRINDIQKHHQDTQDALAQAIQYAEMLQTRPPGSMTEPLSQQYIETIGAMYGSARDYLDKVDGYAKDPGMLSQSLLVRGNINLFMATFPRPQASATQPSMISVSADQAYSEATDAFKKIVDQYPQQHMNVLAARFGLATLAEDHGDWTGAHQQLQAIVDDADAPAVYQSRAKAELASIDKMQKPPMVVEKEISPLINPTLLLPPQSLEVPRGISPSSAPAASTAPAAKAAPLATPTTTHAATQPK